MCQVKTFQYDMCGHFYAKILSACKGTITHTTRAGITKPSCNPTKSLREKKDAPVIHYPGRCLHCQMEALRAHGQAQVDVLKEQSEASPVKKLKRRAREAELQHERTCATLDSLKIEVPVAKRDIVLPSPQMRQRVIVGSPLQNEVTYGAPDIDEAMPNEEAKPTKINSPRRLQQSSLRSRRACRTYLGQCITQDCRHCKKPKRAVQDTVVAKEVVMPHVGGGMNLTAHERRTLPIAVSFDRA
ncbi:hypothetical protein CLAFUW4_08269 [Fulvia fulva]|uniref:Uncharacterized protein n=1 Tax=Passalora fulva TaxID=5499 RepID=A0A9Q8P6B8_PASFU|nr:uncharacterized protein CLAFUR5_08378 [Fulvia fulva]KAK4629345.1 hypothetical protein CLAFUR4_08274 [Fulvia fulva]KAK4630747.1 hypothetical protein CLAFUR0_08269 [Fulvia fulva]UJO14834.1 hypothetical protein CLAFUR5_08378 [Fulvia fulva]WPV12279.1 hypothetical protein CLAFUW4_08269 [Fulvia fulva]WPV27231.1 hypothetical protein CLAFUW7_08269 [Fulvia fulva]